MLATPHILTGAAVGERIRRPWIALPVAFLSHFVLDYIPHLDSHGMFGKPAPGVESAEAIAAVVDVLIGVLLLLWVSRGQPGRRMIFWGASLGILIDLADNVPPLSSLFRGWTGTSWLSVFHHAHQHNVPLPMWPLGFSTQLAVLAVAVWFVRRGGEIRSAG